MPCFDFAHSTNDFISRWPKPVFFGKKTMRPLAFYVEKSSMDGNQKTIHGPNTKNMHRNALLLRWADPKKTWRYFVCISLIRLQSLQLDWLFQVIEFIELMEVYIAKLQEENDKKVAELTTEKMAEIKEKINTLYKNWNWILIRNHFVHNLSLYLWGLMREEVICINSIRNQMKTKK